MVEFFRFVQSPAGALDVDDDGVMDHAIHDGRGDHGIPEVVTQGLEVDVGGQPCGVFPVAGIDDLEEQGGVSRGFLLQAIEAKLIDEQDPGAGVLLQLFLQGVICQPGEQVRDHGRGRGIAAPVELLAGQEHQGLGQVALSGAGVAGKDDPLVAIHEGQGGQGEDLVLVHAGLEVEVEVRQEFTFRQFALPDPSLDAAFGDGLDLEGQQAAEGSGQVKIVLVGPGQFPVDDLLQGKQFQAFQLQPDRFQF